MIQFNSNSWHYNLIRFVFGDSLFVEKKFDVDATVKKIEEEESEFHNRGRNVDSKEFKKQH